MQIFEDLAQGYGYPGRVCPPCPPIPQKAVLIGTANPALQSIIVRLRKLGREERWLKWELEQITRQLEFLKQSEEKLCKAAAARVAYAANRNDPHYDYWFGTREVLWGIAANWQLWVSSEKEARESIRYFYLLRKLRAWRRKVRRAMGPLKKLFRDMDNPALTDEYLRIMTRHSETHP